mgnify:CR=1 FL=1
MSAHPCPSCSAPGIYRGTYKSRYGALRYRRYNCANGHKWREDLKGAQVEIKRGRLPRTVENRPLKFTATSVKETPCLLAEVWNRLC